MEDNIVKKKKNLLFLFTDQQRRDTMEVYGNTFIHVPNLNELAKDSCVFDRAYVSSPVCTPSRSTIVTGLYPHTNGMIKNNTTLADEFPALAEMVKPSGYFTGYMGKWHLGNEVISQHGFDTWISIEDNYRKHYTKEEYKSCHSSYHEFLRSRGYQPDIKDKDGFERFSRMYSTRIPEKDSKPAFLADEANKFISTYKEDPFVLFVNFLEPHPPYFSCFDDYYKPEEVPLPPAFLHPISDDKPFKYKVNAENAKNFGRHEPLDSEIKWRQLIAKYYGSITLVDKYIGIIIQHLKNCGLFDDTIIVFTSDHGDMLGDYGMLAKGCMLESASRVPFLIRIPGLTEKQIKISEPVCNIDIVPTLLDIMEVEKPKTLQGESLYPAILGNESLKEKERAVFMEYLNSRFAKGKVYTNTVTPNLADKYPGWQEILEKLYPDEMPERCIVSNDLFKLIMIKSGEYELYDLKNDPLEENNLYYKADYAEKVVELRMLFEAWQKSTKDDVKFDFE